MFVVGEFYFHPKIGEFEVVGVDERIVRVRVGNEAKSFLIQKIVDDVSKIAVAPETESD